MSRIMNRYASAAVALAVLALAACEKNTIVDITKPVIPTTQVRFFNFGVNAPQLNFYANETKMAAINSSLCSPTPTDTVQQRICRESGQEATTGIAYGGVGASGLYSVIEPGSYTLKGTIAATTDKNLAVASLPVTLDAAKVYSFYVSGFYNTTAKTVDAFVVEDPIPALDWTKATVRFVNAISNSNPMTLTVRDSTTKTETAIGTTVAYKSAGTFVAVDPGVVEFYTTVPGSATKVIARTGVTLAAGRIYTVSARGDITVSFSGTATNRAFLDVTANR
jgi:hypothetical protein